jgi:hypothetical protein
MIIDINLLKFLKYYYSWENSSWANILCDLLQKFENWKLEILLHESNPDFTLNKKLSSFSENTFH